MLRSNKKVKDFNLRAQKPFALVLTTILTALFLYVPNIDGQPIGGGGGCTSTGNITDPETCLATETCSYTGMIMCVCPAGDCGPDSKCCTITEQYNFWMPPDGFLCTNDLCLPDGLTNRSSSSCMGTGGNCIINCSASPCICCAPGSCGCDPNRTDQAFAIIATDPYIWTCRHDICQDLTASSSQTAQWKMCGLTGIPCPNYLPPDDDDDGPDSPDSSPSPSPSPLASPDPSATASPYATTWPTATPEPSASATASPTFDPYGTPTATASEVPSGTVGPSASATTGPFSTPTATASEVPSGSQTPGSDQPDVWIFQ